MIGVINFTYEGRDYDRRVIGTSDVAFWVQECRGADGPVLELGCGTGRVTIPVAEAGVDVTGLDNSESMLRRAHRKSAEARVDVRWVEGDMRSFDLSRRFALIYVPLASFAHMSGPGDAAACLDRVIAHLAPGGRFAIDLMNPEYNGALSPHLVERPESEVDILTAGPVIKSHSLEEMDLVLASTGFEIVEFFGDYDRSQLGKGSPRLLMVAESR